MKLILLVVVLFFLGIALACSCLVLPYEGGLEAQVKHKLKSAEAIFVGTITSANRIDDFTEKLVFKVSDSLKGVDAGEVVMIQGACASPILKKGGSYLIYASIIESNKVRAPLTCWEIAISDPQATKEIELLHRLRE